MSEEVSYEMAKQYASIFMNISAGILNRVGPFMKESIYRDLLVVELNKLNIETSCETVFNYKFKDSENKICVIGNNHFLKSDVELLKLDGIIELKQSGNATKQENIWQLRNYLEQRDDRYWGIVINFISKFGDKVTPYIQCDLLYSTGKQTINKINTYYRYTLISEKEYPAENEILVKKEVEL
jgi:hypothetical protein